VIFYIGRLGFYSDDLGIVAALLNSKRQAPLSLFKLLYSGDFLSRPVQVVYITTVYELSGINPRGYHITTAVNLVVIVCLTLS